MMNKIIKLITIISIITLLNVNESYAITSKQDVNEYIKIVEENFQDILKEDKMKDGRIFFSTYNVYGIDGRKYFSYHNPMTPDGFDDNYYQMEDTIKKVFKEYFDKNLNEKLSDEERLIDYIVTGGDCLYTKKENYKYGDDIEAKVGAIVFPASENTVWSKKCEKVVGKEYGYGKNEGKIVEIEGYATEDYYIHLKMQDEKYIITYLDTVPEGFSDFVERMKTHGIDLENIDYAKLINSKSETEIIAEAVQKENFEAEKIIKTKSRINLFVISVCSFGIIVIIIVNINYIKKLKKRS